jgi:hypothetical protein
MASERDFPYDPAARVEQLSGLEKLRAVQDRGLAALMFDLWFRVAPDLPLAEEYDPGTYGDEPDTNQLHDPTDSLADERDRNNAALHFCWKEFYRSMEDYERKHGRRLNQKQRAQHVWNFAGLMERTYGTAYPSSAWVERRKDWESRSSSNSKGGFGS